MNKPRRHTTLFAIEDRKALAAEIQRAIEESANGVLSEAARKARMNQPELHRLAHGQIGAIGRKTIAALRRLVPPARHRHLEDSLIAPEAGELLRAHQTWRRRWLSRLIDRRDLGDTYVGRAIQTVPGWETQRLLEVEHLLDTCRKEFPDLFEEFDSLLQRKRHSQTRAEIAFYRILEPLLESRESGFVERSWDELERSELRRFVQAGMDRERILLMRSPDTQRAQQQARRNPVELVRLYGHGLDMRAFTGRGTNVLVAAYVRSLIRPR